MNLLEAIVRQRHFMDAVINTVIIGLAAAFINLGLSAWIGKKLAQKSSAAMDTLIMAPLIIPLFLMMSAIHISMIKLGIVDNIAAVILVHLLPSLPYSIKICRNAYIDLGDKYFEQAEIMGAGKTRRFFEVSLPLLKSAYQYTFMLSFAISAGQYATTAIIGGGSVVTLSMLYFPFFNSIESGYAAVFSLIFIFVPLLVYFFFKLIYAIIQKLAGWL